MRLVGQRYAGCRLQNFQATTTEQNAVIAQVQSYVDCLPENVDAGRGIFLFGPSGTGKDHLATGVMFRAIGFGFSVEWTNGLDWFGQLRDGISSSSNEAAIIRKLVQPDVLVVSDPLPMSGGLTAHQSAQLWRVVDQRYRACRPTIITINVANRDEAETGIGVSTIDRLIDGSLTLHCNWPSYRRPRR